LRKDSIDILDTGERALTYIYLTVIFFIFVRWLCYVLWI